MQETSIANGNAYEDPRVSGAVLVPENAYSGEDTRVTVPLVTEAVAEVMKASNPGGAVDQALAAKIGGDIRPALEKSLKGHIGSGSELIGLTTFRNILNQYLGSPASGYVDAETRKAIQRTLETANRTGSDFAALISQRGIQLASLAGLSGATLRDVARAEGHKSSFDLSYTFNGGPYSASNLSGDMRGYVDTAHGITADHVAGVGNYLTGLSISVQQYMGYFVGASDTVRSAIQDHIRSGAKLTDDQIKNSHDVTAIIGAIKAGKVKPEDAPPAVQKIMQDMKAKGLDPVTSDSKAIDNYFKDNPKALEAVKKEVAEAAAAEDGISSDQLKGKLAGKVIDPAAVPAKAAKATNVSVANTYKL